MPTEGASCGFSSHFYFSPCFLTAAFFNEICYSIHDVFCLPSVNQANKSPLLSSHAHELIEEDGDSDFPLLFIFFPFHHFFSQLLFQIKSLSLWPCWLPPLGTQVKSVLLLPSPACMLCGYGSDSEFSSHFYSPHSTLFSNPI